MAQRGAAHAHRVHVGQRAFVAQGQANAGVLQAVLQRLRAEQLRQRHGDGAQLQHGDVGDRRFKALRHHDGHAVAARHAQAHQRVRQAIGAGLQLGIGMILAASARLVCDDSYSFRSIVAARPAPAAQLSNVHARGHAPAKAALHGGVVVIWQRVRAVAGWTLGHGESPE